MTTVTGKGGKKIIVGQPSQTPSSGSSGGSSGGGSSSGSSGRSSGGGSTPKPSNYNPALDQNSSSFVGPRLPNRTGGGTVPMGPSGQGSGIVYQGGTGRTLSSTTYRSSGGSSNSSNYNPALDQTSQSFVGPLRPQDTQQQQQGPVQPQSILSETRNLSQSKSGLSQGGSSTSKPSTSSFEEKVDKPYGSYIGTESKDKTMAEYNKAAQIQRVFASEQTLKERRDTLEQRSQQLQGSISEFGLWQKETSEKIEQKRASIDSTSEKEVSDFNEMVNSFNIQSKQKSEMIKTETTKYSQEAQLLNQDVSRFNYFQEKRQKDLTKIEEKVKAYEKKYTKQEKFFDTNKPNTSFQPMFKTTEKIPFYESIPLVGGIISSKVGRGKAIQEINAAQQEFNQKWFPILDNKSQAKPTSLPKDTLFAGSISPDVGQAFEINKAGVSYGNVDTGNVIMAQYTTKQAREQGMSFNPYDIKQKTDKQILEKLSTNVQSFKAKEDIKVQATAIGTFVGVGYAGGTIIPALTKAPAVGKVVSLLSSKPAQVALWGAYGATEGYQVYSGVQDIKSGSTSLGTQKLKMVAARSAGTYFGVQALKAPAKITQAGYKSNTLRVSNKEKIVDLTQEEARFVVKKPFVKTKEYALRGYTTETFTPSTIDDEVLFSKGSQKFIFDEEGLGIKITGESKGKIKLGETTEKADLIKLNVANGKKVTTENKLVLSKTKITEQEPLIKSKTMSEVLEVPKSNRIVDAKTKAIYGGKTTEVLRMQQGDMTISKFKSGGLGTYSQKDIALFKQMKGVNVEPIKGTRFKTGKTSTTTSTSTSTSKSGDSLKLFKQVVPSSSNNVFTTAKNLIPVSKTITSTTPLLMQLNLPKTKQTNKMSIFTTPKATTLSTTKQKGFVIPQSMFVSQITSQKQDQVVIQDIMPVQKVIGKQMQQQELQGISGVTPVEPVVVPNTGLLFPPLGLPPLGGSSSKKRGSFYRTKRGFRYSPSLVAQVFNIRAKKKNRKYLTGETIWTGAEIRPL